MAIDRYEIVNTCGGHCFITELGPAGDMVYFDDHSTAVASLLAALCKARVYVKDAYFCAFPNEAENAEVLAAIDAAIAEAEGGAA